MREVVFYTRAGCHLCEQARSVVDRARRRAPFLLRVVDIDSDPRLKALYGEDVPVIAIDGRDRFRWSVDEDAFAAAVAAPPE